VKTYSGDGLDDDTTAEVPEVIHNDSGGRVRARRLSSDQGSFDDGSAHGVIGKPKQSQIIKECFSKASAITTSSLRTAIQAAKYRGQQGSSRDEDNSDSNPVLDPTSKTLCNLYYLVIRLDHTYVCNYFLLPPNLTVCLLPCVGMLDMVV
jgi:hypothetical protein